MAGFNSTLLLIAIKVHLLKIADLEEKFMNSDKYVSGILNSGVKANKNKGPRKGDKI